MAFITVAQLKTFIANLPAGADALEVNVPDTLTLAVLTNRTQTADGTFYTVKGYVHIGTRSYEPVP